MGSPHTRRGYVWHIGLTMQALTSTDPREILELIATCEVPPSALDFMRDRK